MGAFHNTAARFAHLLGPLAHAPAAQSDDEGTHAEDDEDRKDDDEKDGRKGRKSNASKSRAEDNDNKDDERGEDDGDDDKGDDKDKDGERSRRGKRGRKARAQDDDEGDEAHAEDGDDEDRKDDDARSASANTKRARLAERARCARIFRCAAAARRPDVAAHLAFDTGMASADAIALLTAIASEDARHGADAATLRARMAGVALPDIGMDGGAQDRDGPQAAADLILTAARHARGEW